MQTQSTERLDRIEFCKIQILEAKKEIELWSKELVEAEQDFREENAGESWKESND